MAFYTISFYLMFIHNFFFDVKQIDCLFLLNLSSGSMILKNNKFRNDSWILKTFEGE